MRTRRIKSGVLLFRDLARREVIYFSGYYSNKFIRGQENLDKTSKLVDSFDSKKSWAKERKIRPLQD